MNKALDLKGELEVEVFSLNSIGCDFYRKYGFVTMEEKIHDQTGFGLIRMRKATKTGGKLIPYWSIGVLRRRLISSKLFEFLREARQTFSCSRLQTAPCARTPAGWLRLRCTGP